MSTKTELQRNVIPLLSILKNQRLFVRNFEAGSYLQSFLVAAVASVLFIRLFLQLTGYPQIGGGGLHIAHMLWGGLLMLASIIVALSFLTKAAASVSAVLGGIGFGAFVDEIGKFITSDNDYFFRPAVSLIYITFILIFLATRAIHFKTTFSRQEYLMNALREMEEVAFYDLDEDERLRALSYLQHSDLNDPLVITLRAAIVRAKSSVAPRPRLLVRIKRFVEDLYYKAVGLKWFTTAVVVFFIGQLLVKLLYVFLLVFVLGLGWEGISDLRIVGQIAARTRNLSFVDWAEISSSFLSGVFVVWGILRIKRSRFYAYRMFERSILVSIFLTQVFSFYNEQFSALAGLLLNIAMLVALRFMIDCERPASVTTA